MSELVQPLSDNTIKNHDFVIIFEGHNQLKSLKLCTNAVIQNRYGVFDHNHIIGKQYGTKVYNRTNNAYVIVLRVTAELWTQVLMHRTQILYLADISYICYMLQLQPGYVVYESGTGSGSLSTSIVKHIAPTGHLYTFEYNIERVHKAVADFTNLGIYQEYVTVYHCDAVKQGFPAMQHNGNNVGVDAIFLDLPTPWLCIANCHNVLKLGGRICTFSPCIEQTQRTCAALREHHFQEIQTVEVSIATYEVSKHTVVEPDLGQPAVNGDSKHAEGTVTDNGAHADADETSDADIDVEPVQAKNKRQRTEKQQQHKKNAHSTAIIQTRPYSDQRGHTAYLTFATCYKAE